MNGGDDHGDGATPPPARSARELALVKLRAAARVRLRVRFQRLLTLTDARLGPGGCTAAEDEELGRLSHTLFGTAGSYGFTVESDAAGRVEKVLAQAGFDEASLAVARSELAKCLDQWDHWQDDEAVV